MASNNNATTNYYNHTLYGSLNGNFVTGKINSGLVTWSNGSDAFKLWSRI